MEVEEENKKATDAYAKMEMGFIFPASYSQRQNLTRIGLSGPKIQGSFYRI